MDAGQERGYTKHKRAELDLQQKAVEKAEYADGHSTYLCPALKHFRLGHWSFSTVVSASGFTAICVAVPVRVLVAAVPCVLLCFWCLLRACSSTLRAEAGSGSGRSR